MEATFGRFFGIQGKKKKKTEEVTPTEVDKDKCYEIVYQNIKRLEALDKAYIRDIDEEGRKARELERRQLKSQALRRFAHRRVLEMNHDIATERQLNLCSLVESFRKLEMERAHIESAKQCLELCKAFTKTLTYDEVASLREELDEKQRELAQIQRLMSKPLRGTPVFDETELENDFYNFIEAEEEKTVAMNRFQDEVEEEETREAKRTVTAELV